MVVADCQKVLTLYGLSHLVTEEEESLDLMDPYQSNGRFIIWHKVMKGSFKIPSSKIFYPEDSLADEGTYNMFSTFPKIFFFFRCAKDLYIFLLFRILLYYHGWENAGFCFLNKNYMTSITVQKVFCIFCQWKWI